MKTKINISVYRLSLGVLCASFLLIVSTMTESAWAKNETNADNAAESSVENAESNGSGTTSDGGIIKVKKKESRRLTAEEASEMQEEAGDAPSTTVRKFHEVLDELLAEFGYDVKTGQLDGLKNVAIRKVEVSDALPKSYEEYVELLVAERIRENSKVRLISCLPCKTKTSTLVEGKLMITSPATNIARLNEVAAQLGIDNFIDVLLVYHTTHMVLAFQIFDMQTKEMLWARTYNSETIKSRFQKLAIDYSQVEKARPGEDYVPEYRFLVGMGGATLPNIGGEAKDKTMVTFQVRSSEKFDNRHSEFGLMLAGYSSVSSLLKDYPNDSGSGDGGESTPAMFNSYTLATDPTPKAYTMAFGLYGFYAHNFLGSVESYNRVRQGMHVGLGGLYATAYLAGSARLGWDIYFGRRFCVSFSAVGVAPSTVLVEKKTVKTKGGVGADVVLSFNF